MATEGSEVRGLALIQRDGEIQMCYLVPELQHRGAGKLMLRALEEPKSVYGLASVYPMSRVSRWLPGESRQNRTG